MLIPEKLNDEQLEQFKTFLFDADGVLWTGDVPVPGAIAFVDELLKRGKQVFIMTNNATKTRAEYAQKVQNIGYGHIKAENIISPAVVLGAHLAENEFKGKKVYCLGVESLKISLEQDAGVQVVGVGPDLKEEYTSSDFLQLSRGHLEEGVTAVVTSFDPHVSWPKISKAINYLQDPNCSFFVTNEDGTLPGPVPGVVIPGEGTISKMVRVAVDREPIVIGKPHPPMSEYLKRHFHIESEKTIMFGDRLDTDVAFANAAGFKSCLLLSDRGCHSEKHIQTARAEGKHHLIPKYTYSYPKC